MNGPPDGVGEPAGPGSSERLGDRVPGLAKAALLIAAVTVGARAVGFLRTVVFARAVGVTCLGDTYLTANTVPNILFQVVAGGALASIVVPVLAGPAERRDARSAGQSASALLSWALLLLVPVALLAAALAGPLMSLLVGGGRIGCARATEVAVGQRMLWVFAPQLVLYGVGVVATGVLQAHRRFVAPALAPLLSSLVVIGCYLWYAGLSGNRRGNLSTLPLGHELVLSVGTTLGVAALSLPLLLPLRRTGVRLRPTLHFPPGVAERVRGLAWSGAAVLAGQQVAAAVVLRLANASGAPGAVVLYNLAWTAFLLPWAALAVPIATSAFPTLAARRESTQAYAALAARTTRAVVLVSALAAAALAAAAVPAARVVVLGAPGQPDPGRLAAALVAFAPGLVGYGLVAHLSRALYARGDPAAPAVSVTLGWASVVVADVALVAALPTRWTVTALGVGNSVGMTVAGVLLLRAVHRATSGAGLVGLPRATGAALAGAGAAGLAGGLAAGPWHGAGVTVSVGGALLAAAVVVVVFAAVVYAFDPADLRALLRRSVRHG